LEKVATKQNDSFFLEWLQDGIETDDGPSEGAQNAKITEFPE